MYHNLYTYHAEITAVYDGDTCTADIDLGLKTWIRGEKLRLSRINAPEVRAETKEAGLRSRDFLRRLLLGNNVLLHTEKDRQEKYGRYLAEIWLEQPDGSFLNINDELVKQGFAVYQEY